MLINSYHFNSCIVFLHVLSISSQPPWCWGAANAPSSFTVCHIIAFLHLLASREVSLLGLHNAFKLAIFQLNFPKLTVTDSDQPFKTWWIVLYSIIKKAEEKVTGDLSIYRLFLSICSLVPCFASKNILPLSYKILGKSLIKSPK
jgi:hypothetical protein